LNLFLEVNEMKKSVFIAIAVTMMLTVTLCLLAQPPAGQGQGQAPGGQGLGQAQSGRGQGQAAGGQGRGGQQGARSQMMSGPMSMVNPATVNAAVTAIETQLAAIKKAMEGAQTMPGRGGSTDTQKAKMGGSGEGGGAMQAMMAQNQQRSQAVQEAAAAIADQVLVLKETQAQSEQEDAITELESIVNLANQEKAVSTAKLAQSIIDARQKAFTEKAAKLGINQQGGRGGMGGMGGMMGGRGSYTPPADGFKYED
jgi:hypothetical protein